MAQDKSAQGKLVDMEKLAKQNELTRAVSNAKVNARGDILGKDGNIVQKREEVVSSYYQSAPTTVAQPAQSQKSANLASAQITTKSADAAPNIVSPIKDSE